MSAPDGYRVTLKCGHTTEWAWEPGPTAWPFFCPTCHKPGHIHRVEPVPPAPPALRSRWVRVLSRVPGLTWLVDAISGPWTGGDDGQA